MIIDWIKEGLEVRARVREKVGAAGSGVLSHWATGKPEDYEAMMAKALSDEVRITATANQHVRSLRELLVIG